MLIICIGGTPLMEQLDGEPASRIPGFAKEHGVITTFDVLAVATPNLTEVVKYLPPLRRSFYTQLRRRGNDFWPARATRNPSVFLTYNPAHGRKWEYDRNS